MEFLIAILVGAGAAYGLFRLYAGYQVSREPETPERATDPTRDAEAVVIESFSLVAGDHINGGKVELKGARWSAENHSPGVQPSTGDRVRVIERRRLTLIVEPVEYRDNLASPTNAERGTDERTH